MGKKTLFSFIRKIYHRKQVNAMYATINLEELKPIVSLFEKDADAPVQARVEMGKLFIQGYRNELMLRFHPHTKEIRIARIEFKETRVGNGTKLVQWLTTYGKENGYNTLVMENVLSKSAAEFSRKHGFDQEKDYFGLLDKNSYYGNYKLAI